MIAHRYGIELTWTGNTGTGTSSYRGFSRDHTVTAAGPGSMLGSSDPAAVMVEEAGGAGRFESVTLHPTVTITVESDPALAARLHDQVGDHCFIARSIDTPIHHEVVVHLEEPATAAVLEGSEDAAVRTCSRDGRLPPRTASARRA